MESIASGSFIEELPMALVSSADHSAVRNSPAFSRLGFGAKFLTQSGYETEGSGKSQRADCVKITEQVEFNCGPT